MRVTAFCPGHITGFFDIREHKDIVRSGSRGAGVCVDRGVTTTINAKRGSGKIDVCLNGVASEAPVTKATIRHLMPNNDLDLKVESALDLPIGQGFGMSAAGALSSAFAMAEMIGASKDEAFRAAHIAEIENKSGMGDVSALHRGGVTFRRTEGLPPFGRIDRIANQLELVCAVVGPEMHTFDVLSSPDKRKAVCSVGKECCDRLAKDPTVETFLSLSRWFALESGIASQEVRSAIEEIDAVGAGSMIMLGNSVFATGDLEKLGSLLSKYGTTYRLRADLIGPRVLVIED